MIRSQDIVEMASAALDVSALQRLTPQNVEPVCNLVLDFLHEPLVRTRDLSLTGCANGIA